MKSRAGIDPPHLVEDSDEPFMESDRAIPGIVTTG
jgi:hypothetical protein